LTAPAPIFGGTVQRGSGMVATCGTMVTPSHGLRCYRSLFDDGLAREKQRPMTLTYALIAEGGIILAADSQETFQHQVVDGTQFRSLATYTRETSKIRTMGKQSAFTIAGNAGLADFLLTRAESALPIETKSFDEIVFRNSSFFRHEYLKMYGEVDIDCRPHCAFLFCGYEENGKKAPRIIRLSSYDTFTCNPVAIGNGYGFTGRTEHGAALYLHHRLYRHGMSLDEAKCLAYCLIAEVATLDNTVGGPIDMVVLTESGVEQFSDFDRYEKKRQQIVQTVRALIRSF
jgi:20S proteasome alpha/beta subunit